MVERVGFEPTVPLTAHKLSKPGLISKSQIYQRKFNLKIAIITLNADS